MNICQNCRNTVEDPWTLCQACRRDYAKALHDLRHDMLLLRKVARREYTLSEHAGAGGASRAEAPAPVDLHALDRLDEIESMLQDACVDAGFTWLDAWPRLLPRMMTRMAVLCRAPHAGRYLRSVVHARLRINPLVDRRPRTRRIVGHCPDCGVEITAASGEQWRVCETCHTLVHIPELRAQAAETVDRYHLTRTPAGLAAWLKSEYGVTVSRKQVTDWIRRGKLPSSKPVDDAPGYWEFNVREVLTLAMSTTV